MPGSGKTTVGQLLAEGLGLDFYDLDSEVESSQGKTISEIFVSGGESLFRKIESETLLNIMSDESSFVLASGGGTPCFYTNMQEMNASGITFYLETPINLLVARTKQNEDRPLLKGNHKEKIKELLLARKKFYKQAMYHVKTATLSPQEIAKRIIESLVGI